MNHDRRGKVYHKDNIICHEHAIASNNNTIVDKLDPF